MLTVTTREIREKFLKFFERNGHTIAPSSSLLPENDPSVLFTTAGMQQFKAYYLDPSAAPAKNAASVQKCLRTSDIDEVGDETHLTFFEMLGNFSFGGYFKEETIQLAHEFMTKELGQTIDYISVFKGEEGIPADLESERIWQTIDSKIKIVKAGKADNFWGPTGEEGPCGPTTEIYINGVEIWNLVFNEYYKDKAGKYEKLKIPGVDTGMGLERLATTLQKRTSVYETDLFLPLVSLINLPTREKRIVADHFKAAAFIIADGVTPGNTGHGYVLRRLIRRIVRFYPNIPFGELLYALIEIYRGVYDLATKRENILTTLEKEKEKFTATLERGEKEIKQLAEAQGYVTGVQASSIFSSYGIPLEIIKEITTIKNEKEFYEDQKKHQELSKTAAAGMFKGGLADTKPETIKLHTAHHLLLAALKEVLGQEVAQRGSNITSERLRLDFSFPRKLTPEEKKKTEHLVNQYIAAGWPVTRKELPKKEAEKLGAEMEFGAKYGDIVSVYLIGEEGRWLSREFCGGPHVENTQQLGQFKILKEEAVAAGIRRIKATLV